MGRFVVSFVVGSWTVWFSIEVLSAISLEKKRWSVVVEACCWEVVLWCKSFIRLPPSRGLLGGGYENAEPDKTKTAAAPLWLRLLPETSTGWRQSDPGCSGGEHVPQVLLAQLAMSGLRTASVTSLRTSVLLFADRHRLRHAGKVQQSRR